MEFEEDDEVIATYIDETAERLDGIEDALLSISRGAGQGRDEVLNSIFRSAHSIKAGANLLKMRNIESISHSMENILQVFRQRRRLPDEDDVTVLLSGIDWLRDLLSDIRRSDKRDVASVVGMLNTLLGQLNKS
ncbi:MAG: Hpt domain-containing protein [Nitrospirae bacterium]|nr:Hpt domain-containing protein [Nitrospirota bacterium]